MVFVFDGRSSSKKHMNHEEIRLDLIEIYDNKLYDGNIFLSQQNGTEIVVKRNLAYKITCDAIPVLLIGLLLKAGN